MVKLVYCIRRKGVSRDEFIRYWSDVHGRSAPAFRDCAASCTATR